MSNSYKYIDPDYTYTDPKTGILRNLQDITDSDELLFVESGVVTKRLQQLYQNPIKIKGIILNLNPPDNKSVYERYMKGTIESDLTILTEVIDELIRTKN